MIRNFNFNYIGNFDTSSLADKIKLLSDADWREFDYRQKKFPAHKETLTIPLLFDNNFDSYPTACKFFTLFEDDINKVHSFFTQVYRTGRFARLILVKLLANSEITPHYDQGSSLKQGLRHHIPIITNDSVSFQISKDIKNLKVNEVWEINNQRLHGVKNSSPEDRVHMIVDWII